MGFFPPLPTPSYPAPDNHRPCRWLADIAPQPQVCLSSSSSRAQVLSSRPARLGLAHPPVSAPESTQSSSSPPAFGFMARVPSALPRPRHPPRASSPASATTRPREVAARRALSRPRPPRPPLRAARARPKPPSEDPSGCTGCARVHERERKCGRCRGMVSLHERGVRGMVSLLWAHSKESLESPGFAQRFFQPQSASSTGETPTSATRAGCDISIWGPVKTRGCSSELQTLNSLSPCSLTQLVRECILLLSVLK